MAGAHRDSPVAFVPDNKNRGTQCKPHVLYVSRKLYLADDEVIDPFCNHLQLDLVQAAEKGDLDGLRRFLAQGATPNATAVNEEFDYKRPLVSAVFAGKSVALRVLLDNGGNVNDYHACCMTRESLLMIAVENQDIECLKLLLARGADAKFQGFEGETAFDVAVAENHPDLVQLLDEAGQLTLKQRAELRLAKLPGMNLTKVHSALVKWKLEKKIN